MVIDFSTHYITGSVAKMLTPAGRETISIENTEIEERLSVMARYGIAIQVVCLTTPALLGLQSKGAAKACHAANDSIYELCEKYPDRFAGLAIVSLLDVESAVEEVDRAIKELGLRGVTVATNQNGVGLDSPHYRPFYERIAKYDIPLFIHPTDWKSYPLIEGENGYGLMMTIGWPFDTTQAMCHLVFGKILEQYPSLKVVTHHLGGFLPSSRVESSGAFLREKLGLKKTLSEYFKQFYGDTALSGMGTIRKEIMSCGYAFFGPNHIVFGSDYPYGGENGEKNIRENLRTIQNMDIPEEEKRRILEENARKLLKLP
ncbi:MAG: amidohydrolase family protein [Candidatus Bathyarchaeota archaeon]